MLLSLVLKAASTHKSGLIKDKLCPHATDVSTVIYYTYRCNAKIIVSDKDTDVIK